MWLPHRPCRAGCGSGYPPEGVLFDRAKPILSILGRGRGAKPAGPKVAGWRLARLPFPGTPIDSGCRQMLHPGPGRRCRSLLYEASRGTVAGGAHSGQDNLGSQESLGKVGGNRGCKAAGSRIPAKARARNCGLRLTPAVSRRRTSQLCLCGPGSFLWEGASVAYPPFRFWPLALRARWSCASRRDT